MTIFSGFRRSRVPPEIKPFDHSQVVQLPDDILLKIFQNVDKRTLLALEESCSRFHLIVRSMRDNIPKVWVEDIYIYGDRTPGSNRIYVFIGERMVDYDTTGAIERKFFHVRTDSLVLRNFRQPTVFQQMLRILAKPQNFLHLSHFQIDFSCFAPENVLKSVFRNQGSTLLSVCVDSAPELTSSLTPVALGAITSNLESLKISAGFNRLQTLITDDVLLKLAKQEYKIEKIRIIDAPLVTAKGIIAVVESWLKSEAHYKRDLQIILGSLEYGKEIHKEVRSFFNHAAANYENIKLKRRWKVLKLVSKKRPLRNCTVEIFS